MCYPWRETINRFFFHHSTNQSWDEFNAVVMIMDTDNYAMGRGSPKRRPNSCLLRCTGNHKFFKDCLPLRQKPSHSEMTFFVCLVHIFTKFRKAGFAPIAFLCDEVLHIRIYDASVFRSVFMKFLFYKYIFHFLAGLNRHEGPVYIDSETKIIQVSRL